MTLDLKIKNNITFTTCQEETKNNVQEWLKRRKTGEDLLYTVSGFAGTGKSTLVRYILSEFDKSCAVSAPTHKAKRIISDFTGKKGETIQSILGLRPNVELTDFDPNKPVFDQRAEERIKNYKLIVVDEASMINNEAFNLIRKKAIQYNTMILFVGDDYQLPPIGEEISKVFSVPNISYLSTIVRQGDTNPNSTILELARQDITNATLVKYVDDIREASNLHKKNECIFKLCDFISKKLKDPKYTKIYNSYLTYLKTVSTDTLNDLMLNIESSKITNNINSLNIYLLKNPINIVNNEGYKVLKKAQFYSNALEQYNNSKYNENLDHIKALCYTNRTVGKVNKYFRDKLNPSKDLIAKGDILTGYRTVSRDVGSGAYETLLENSRDYKVEDVQIVTEIIMGVSLKGFRTKTANVYKPMFILHPDSYEAFVKEYELRLAKARKYRRFKSFNAFKDRVVVAENLPNEYGKIVVYKDIDYGYAITTHKSQGSTYNNSAVLMKDLNTNSNPLEKRKLIYVALSRVQELNLLYYG